MGWINVLSFRLWIYGEEIFKRVLKQKKKATGNMALLKMIAETFLQERRCKYFIEVAANSSAVI